MADRFWELSQPEAILAANIVYKLKNVLMKYKQLSNYSIKVILALIALLPLIYYNQIEAVPIKAFILGTGSWGIGLIFKMLAHQLIVVPLQYKKQTFGNPK